MTRTYRADDGLHDGGARGVVGDVQGPELLPQTGIGGGITTADAPGAAEAQGFSKHHRCRSCMQKTIEDEEDDAN